MYSQYNTYVQVFEFQNKPWIRISGQIYLDMTDIDLAGRRILELCTSNNIKTN